MKFLPVILLVVLAIYSWIEIAQSDPSQVREMSRAMWALLAWLVYGRPNGNDPNRPAPVRRTRSSRLAPDDDPDFLRSLRRPPKPPDEHEHP